MARGAHAPRVPAAAPSRWWKTCKRSGHSRATHSSRGWIFNRWLSSSIAMHAQPNRPIIPLVFHCTVACLTTLLCLTQLAHGADTQREMRVAIIGDSTVCEYPASSNIRGWGQFVAPACQPHVRVLNLAKSGRSTKTFIKEGLWETTLAQKPDFVLIQFGHNDSHAKERPESTDAATDFREFLRRYVDEARAAGATPVLVTPMHRRNFDKEGKATQELLPYAEAMKAVAKEKQVGLVDLHTVSGKLFEKLGDAGSADLSCSPTDRTHFSEKGAKAMAELVLSLLPSVETSLKPLLKP